MTSHEVDRSDAKHTWQPFLYQGSEYPLDHLNAFLATVEVGDGKSWSIFIVFQDHCFTRMMTAEDDPALSFSRASGRGLRCFCFERYSHSLRLKDRIAYAMKEKIYIAKDQNLMVVDVVDASGYERYYVIFFSIVRSKHRDSDFLLHVESAYPIEGTPPPDFGPMTFKNLLQRVWDGKPIPRNFGRSTRWPTLEK